MQQVNITRLLVVYVKDKAAFTPPFNFSLQFSPSSWYLQGFSFQKKFQNKEKLF